MKERLTAVVLSVCAVAACYAQTDSVSTSKMLQEVVVTGTGTKHLLRNAPVQTEVITQQMLSNYSGKSLEDILSGLTSSFAFNEGDMGSQMQMNGLGNSYILILIDGKRIHGDIGGENELSLIDPHNIEKIEIVKGASSALYGSDAIAGVINIITRKHDEGLLAENSTRVGSYGDLRQHNGLGFRIGKLSSYTNFQLQHSDGWQNTSVEHTSPTEEPVTDSQNKTVNRHTNWQIAERLTYTFNPNIDIYAEGSTYWKRIYRPLGHNPHYDVHTYDLQYSNQSVATGGKWKLNDNDDIITLDIDWNRHAYYYQFTATTLVEDYEKSAGTIYYPYFPYLEGQHELQSDQQRTMAALKGVFTLPFNNRLSAGAEYRYDYLKAPNRVEEKTVDDYTAAIYLQDEFSLVKNLNITAGIRFNQNKQFGFRATPKVSAMYSIANPFKLRATWSQGFKTPTPKELYYRYVRQMSGTYLYLGNTELNPQTSNYFSMSGEYTWKGLSVTVTGYHNNVKNMIELVTIPNYLAPDKYIVQYDPVKTRQYQNIETAKTYGVELNVQYGWKEFSLGGSYSYLDTEAKQYDSDHERIKTVVIDGMAHHRGNVFATWNHRFSPSYKLGLGIYGRMSSKRYYQIDGNGKGYQIWRISTSHDLGQSKKFNYRIEAGVDNIFNHVDRAPHGLHLGTNTPGTTVYATLSVRFANGKKNIYKTKSNFNKRNNEED